MSIPLLEVKLMLLTLSARAGALASSAGSAATARSRAVWQRKGDAGTWATGCNLLPRFCGLRFRTGPRPSRAPLRSTTGRRLTAQRPPPKNHACGALLNLESALDSTGAGGGHCYNSQYIYGLTLQLASRFRRWRPAHGRKSQRNDVTSSGKPEEESIRKHITVP